MLVPAIDLMGGHIVQLVQGERLALQSDDFDYWMDRFSTYKLVQLVDLDAAKGQGDNRALLGRVLRKLPCQVGGGLRSAEDARRLLEMGARRVVFGSALFSAGEANDTGEVVREDFARDLAETLGAERLVFSIDTKGGQVAVRGWRQQVALAPEEALRRLSPYCAAFLYTHVDTEGTLQGFPFPVAQRLRALTQRQLIVAGGIRDRSEIDALDAIGVDAVAGMAVYTGALPT
jgi:phosphoribosylformimino-5-aminoimidazole carboxamide ribotide isomerase